MPDVVIDQYSIKYRPQTLDDVLGQPKAVRDCKNFISTKKIPACLLISGKTGTGKTTIARILARAINVNEQDIHEYNVSDKRRIEDIREISERISYKPFGNEKHIIILDEVHQMQKQSASALLKLFEETNTIWVLCTDQPNLLLKTIRDRAYKLPLEDVKKEAIVDLLKRINKKEMKLILDSLELKITEEGVKGLLTANINQAVESIAAVVEGCPREALQLLQGYMIALEGVLQSYKEEGRIDQDTLQSTLSSILTATVVEPLTASTTTLTAHCTGLILNYVMYKTSDRRCKEDGVGGVLDKKAVFLNRYISNVVSITADSIYGILKFSPSAILAVLSVISEQRSSFDSSEFLALSLSKSLREANLDEEGRVNVVVFLSKYFATLNRLQHAIATPYFDVAEYAKAALLEAIYN